jgi:hypothetical protein
MTLTIEDVVYAVPRIVLDEECARIMGFKKVHWFMGKLCVQIQGDVANNNIPWSPSTNMKDAFQIMRRYGLALRPYAHDAWCCYSEYAEAYDTDMLVAICKSLVAHSKVK